MLKTFADRDSDALWACMTLTIIFMLLINCQMQVGKDYVLSDTRRKVCAISELVTRILSF